MLKEFIIQSSMPRTHNSWANYGLPQSHPHWWDALDKSGHICVLLSKRNDYHLNSQVMIDVATIGTQTNFYMDHSPARALNKGTITPPPAPAPLAEVNSDIIVMVHAVEPQKQHTLVSGSVFYFDPRLKDLPGTLRSAFREKAPISVTTHLKDYNFHNGHTYIFENLRDITVSHDRILATDARMPCP